MSRRISVAAEDRRRDDVPTSRLRRVAKDLVDRQRGPDDILAKDVLELDGLGRRWDRLRVELGELRVLVDDVVQLPLEKAQLAVGQAEPREMRDVLDVAAGEAGHAPDDIRRTHGN